MVADLSSASPSLVLRTNPVYFPFRNWSTLRLISISTSGSRNVILSNFVHTSISKMFLNIPTDVNRNPQHINISCSGAGHNSQQRKSYSKSNVCSVSTCSVSADHRSSCVASHCLSGSFAGILLIQSGSLRSPS